MITHVGTIFVNERAGRTNSGPKHSFVITKRDASGNVKFAETRNFPDRGAAERERTSMLREGARDYA
jgi:hypothetical protein